MHAFNKQRIQSQMKSLRAKFDNGAAKVFAGTALVVGPISGAFAQAVGDQYDPTADVAKIAAAVAVAVVISVAFTSGYIGIKSSKLPRRGA